MKHASLFLLYCFSPALLPSQVICTSEARRCFDEARAIGTADDAHLWNVQLYGPLMFVDESSRSLVANQQDCDNDLKAYYGVYIGKLPNGQFIANTAFDWEGERWTMIMWPLPKDDFDRQRLMMHELYHRVQDKIIPGCTTLNNDHLDTREGRTWLQLEWRALAKALENDGRNRRTEVEDALVFRTYRRMLFPGSDTTEISLEIFEGLAEYTGIKLATRSTDDLVQKTIAALSRIRASFVRSFGYLSGPAYGVLLDLTGRDWRDSITKDSDLGKFLQESMGIHLPGNTAEEALKRAVKYQFAELNASEVRRESERSRLVEDYRARLINGPVMVIEMTDNFSAPFNPNTVVPLGPGRTIFPATTITADWGIMDVNGGILLDQKTNRAYVEAPSDINARPITTKSWRLQLKDGWIIVPDVRKGDFVLKKIVR